MAIRSHLRAAIGASHTTLDVLPVWHWIMSHGTWHDFHQSRPRISVRGFAGSRCNWPSLLRFRL